MIILIVFQLAEWIGNLSLFVEETVLLDMLAFAYPAIRSRHEDPKKPATEKLFEMYEMTDISAQNFKKASVVGEGT